MPPTADRLRAAKKIKAALRTNQDRLKAVWPAAWHPQLERRLGDQPIKSFDGDPQDFGTSKTA